MKKNTLSFLLFGFVLSIYSQNSYSELDASGISMTNNNLSKGFEVVSNNLGRLPVLETYTDRTDFENAYDADCTVPLISEDF